MKTVNFDSAKAWIYRNARPIDFARWQFHFENGNKENILNILSSYQNSDSGFGHALEADAWNPNSSPIQTWAAIELLREIEIEDKSHPLIIDILRYLNSGRDFSDGKWLNTIKTNDNFPHAFWWDWNPESNYNPTANFCGFILKYADKNSALYSKGKEIAKDAITSFMDTIDAGGHLILCYLRLMQALTEMEIEGLYDLEAFQHHLSKHIKHFLEHMELDWCCDGVAYEFIKSHKDNLHLLNSKIDIVNAIYKNLADTQQPDGSFPIPWQWNEYPEEWAVSKNWWKAYGIINNMLFLKEFGFIVNFI